jgi:NAD(P)-dependent dehydrogenase (short-subunit alcohol dehydrogenase family)
VLTSEAARSDVPAVEPLLHSGRAHYIQADLRRDDEGAFLVGEASIVLGGLDVLVNNLGTFAEPAFGKLKRADFDRVFGVNVWSAIALTQEFVKRNHNRGGRIVFTTSLNATRSEPGHTLYDASKAAVSALARQLAVELATQGFTTAAIAPGLVETPLTDMGLRSTPGLRDAVTAQIPLRRIAAVEDLAPWFVFLASDAAAYSTGSVFTVDGGLDAQQMAVR